MDRPAGSDQQSVIGRHGVETSEPAPARRVRVGLHQREPACQRDPRKPFEPLDVIALRHRLPAYKRSLIAALTVATAALAVVVAAAQSSLTNSLLRGLLVLAVVPCAAIDLDRRIIPNRITGPGALVALAVGLALDPGGEPSRLLAAVLAGGFLLIAALAKPAGMGMGDVKLTAMMGLFLGAAVGVALFAALLASAVAGIVIAARRGVRVARKTGLPLGPYLAAGGVFAALAGNAIVHAYLTMHP